MLGIDIFDNKLAEDNNFCFQKLISDVSFGGCHVFPSFLISGCFEILAIKQARF